MYYYVRLICKASVYKLFSELFLATSCLLHADTVFLKAHLHGIPEVVSVLRNEAIAHVWNAIKL